MYRTFLKIILPLLIAILCGVLLRHGRSDTELELYNIAIGAKDHPATNLFIFLSSIGSMIFTTIVVLALSMKLVLMKNYKMTIYYLTSFFFVIIFAYGLKIILELPRPDSGLWLTHAKSYTFPSGHATRIAFLMLSFWAFFKSKNNILLIISLAVMTLVSYSRVYLGVHYPLDVLMGIFIGISGHYFFRFAQESDPLGKYYNIS